MKLKYKHTVLGHVWTLFYPTLQLTILATVFSHVVRWEMRQYAFYVFSGLLAWTFFGSSLITSAWVFIENENLIKKVYLPKILFPVSKVCLRAVDFLVSFFALTFLAALMGYRFTSATLLLPAATLCLVVFTVGMSLVVSIATVYFRDIQYLVTLLLPLVYLMTPVLYPIDAIPGAYRLVLELNPVYIQIRLFQSLLYEGTIPQAGVWGTAILTAFLSLGAGVLLLVLKEEELVFRL